MEDTRKEQSTDRPFCEEQAAAGNRLFRISRLFAEPASEPWLLPLYALFSAIEEAGSRVSDETVAARKLLWWREELTVRGIDGSAHPILRLLRSSGAGQRLPASSLLALVDSALARLDPEPPGDMEDLRKWCTGIGQPMIELEMGAAGADPEEAGQWGGSAARAGFAQLLRDGGHVWLPMSLLASHGLSRREAAETGESKHAAALLREVADTASRWPDSDGRGMPDGSQHLHVIHALYRRKLERLAKQRSPDGAAELNRPRLGDLATAWTAARQFSRR